MNKLLCLALFVLVLSSGFAQTKSSAISKYNEAMIALDQELPNDAIVLFREALSINPNYLDAILGLVNAYYSLDEYDEALRYVKMASPLGKDSAKVLTAHGRILLALGKLEEASTIFKSVQKREPYNIDALLGIAEFSLAKGDDISALKEYANSEKYNPTDRRILLSLAVMYEDKGLKGDSSSKKKSEDYLIKALNRYPESPLVQTMAAEYYFRAGNFKDAIFHAGTAITLQPKYIRAMLVLARAYLASSSPSEALAIITQITNMDSKNTESLYLYAIAQKDLNKIDLAIAGLEKLLLLKPSDEIARILLENFIMSLPDDSELRIRHAQFHIDQAIQYKKKNLLARAGFHYKRAIQIAPSSLVARRGYAEYLKASTQNARFLRELETLKKLGAQDNFITDNTEIYTSLLQNGVSKKWKIDQFGIDRDPIILRLFYSPMQLEHTKSLEVLALYLQNQIATSDKLSFGIESEEFSVMLPREVKNASEPFRISRDEKADYYILTQIGETGENFMVQADVYLARTGNKIKSFQAFRSGNFRVQNAMVSIAEQIQAMMPVRGSLINRQISDGLINLGTVDGIKVGDVLEIVNTSAYVLQGETPGFAYSADKKLGTFTITKLDDLVAEGIIKREGIVDKVNIGDAILKKSEVALKPSDATANFPILYNRIRGIR